VVQFEFWQRFSLKLPSSLNLAYGAIAHFILSVVSDRLAVGHGLAPSTSAISSAVKPYRSYTLRSIAPQPLGGAGPMDFGPRLTRLFITVIYYIMILYIHMYYIYSDWFTLRASLAEAQEPGLHSRPGKAPGPDP
jgi:hypothetical protein